MPVSSCDKIIYLDSCEHVNALIQQHLYVAVEHNMNASRDKLYQYAQTSQQQQQ